MVSNRAVLFVVIICSVLASAPAEESSFEVQIQALKAFKNSITEDPFGTLADWTDGNPHCNWSGIACDPSLNVISISAVDKKLKGVLTPFLRNLSSLQVLDLAVNSFTGSIPSDIGLLSKLKKLTLNRNLLQGCIPTSITNCTHLAVVMLSRNRLEGQIPQGLGQLRNLTSLYLAFNKLSGEIPDDLFNCSNLRHLDLSQNNLSGGLKPGISKLSSLQVFRAHVNSLGGSILPEIGNLSLLFTLTLGENSFSGLVPSELFNLSGLQGLDLNGNDLEGAIPEKIAELQQLTELTLQNNRFQGPIPGGLLELGQLSYLDLHGNMLSGSIPRSMGNLSQLLALDLSHNHLTGSIPESVIPGLANMQLFLNFSYNFLAGTIPAELGMMEMVQAIVISNNNLSGIIPKTLCGCRNLFSLDLSVNNLSGPIPAQALTRLYMLTRLNLSRNNLDGGLPELRGLKQLILLDLSQNQLSGTIPKSFSNLSTLKQLNLSFNQLEGQVPESGIFRHINSSSFRGNPGLCGTELLRACSKSSLQLLSKKTVLILAILGSCSVLLFLVLVILILNRRSKLRVMEEKAEHPEPDYTLASTLRRFGAKELEIATDFLSENNIIGTSFLSTVYKGRLPDGEIVAVKKLNLHQFSEESDKYFFREINTLIQLRHRNLVKVLGYAWESGKLKAVVLQFMENGNLDSIIHDPQVDQTRWTLPERVRVLISIATGLDYLHSGYDFPVVHCDIKPSNILLDGDWVAHVSDFGTARMLGIHLQDGSSVSASSAFEGTIGYLAPELAYMAEVTTKVDVFSFGTIVMEFLTRRRPTGLMEEDGTPITLRQLVEKALANGMNSLHQILDPMLVLSVSKKHEEVLVELLKLALSCTFPNPKDRPHIDGVLSVLLKLSMARC